METRVVHTAPASNSNLVQGSTNTGAIQPRRLRILQMMVGLTLLVGALSIAGASPASAATWHRGVRPAHPVQDCSAYDPARDVTKPYAHTYTLFKVEVQDVLGRWHTHYSAWYRTDGSIYASVWNGQYYQLNNQQYFYNPFNGLPWTKMKVYTSHTFGGTSSGWYQIEDCFQVLDRYGRKSLEYFGQTWSNQRAAYSHVSN